MTSWLRRVWGRVSGVGHSLGTASPRPTPMRRRGLGRVESLEGRAMPAVGGVIPFTTVAGQVAVATTPAQVGVAIQPGELAMIHGKAVLLGFQATPAAGSPVSPMVIGVLGPAGGHLRAAADTSGGNIIIKLKPPKAKAAGLTVSVASQNLQVGGVSLGLFLAGDVNGDGSVDAGDIAAIRKAYGSRAGSANYNPAADFTNVGRVSFVDLQLARRNFGASAPTSAASASASAAAPVSVAATPATARASTTATAPPQPECVSRPALSGHSSARGIDEETPPGVGRGFAPRESSGPRAAPRGRGEDRKSRAVRPAVPGGQVLARPLSSGCGRA